MALVWDCAEVKSMRRDQKVMGALVGGIAGFKQQNTVNGLPLYLCEEELQVIHQAGSISETEPPGISAVSGEPVASEPGKASWRQKCEDGSTLEFPVSSSRAQGPSGLHAGLAPPALEKERRLIFEDLHARGYFITGGSKFGADYLVYPGDPSLYHAQYCVRVVEPSTCFSPALLAGAARGSHAARKHLLLATVKQDLSGDRPYILDYLTIAPEAGFGQ